MSNDEHSTEYEQKGRKTMKHNESAGLFYGMGFIGAAIYFIGHATSFWVGVYGFIKAIFWPAVLMYSLLEYLKL